MHTTRETSPASPAVPTDRKEMGKYELVLFNGEASGNLFIAFNNSTLLAEVFCAPSSEKEHQKASEAHRKVK